MEHDNEKIFKLGDMVFLIGFSWWINSDMEDMPIHRIKAEDVLILKGKVVAKETLEQEK